MLSASIPGGNTGETNGIKWEEKLISNMTLRLLVPSE